MSTRHRRRALTLVELLTVMAILSLLAAMIYPAFGRARRKASETTCVSHLRQIGQAVQMYRTDWELPPWWIHQLYPNYVTSGQLFQCAADPYLTNGGLTFRISWCLFYRQPLMGLQLPYFPVSYLDDGYMRQPTRRRVLMTSPSGSYTACVLHGEQLPGRPNYHGKVLRLGFDGAVRAVHGRDHSGVFNFWMALCDEPYPALP